MTKRIFLLQFALTAILAAMVWRIAHTGKAPLESERDASTRLAWVDRSGTVIESFDLKGRYIQPRLSTDGKTALLTRLEPGAADIWSLSLASHAVKRLTAAKKRSAFAVWGPGDRYVFAYHGKLLQKAAGKRPEALDLGNTPDMDWLFSQNVPEDWSADGRSVVFTAADNGRISELFLLRTGAASAFPLLSNRVRAYDARFSRDGNRIALTASMAGHNEVYVSPVPGGLSDFPVPEQRLIRVSEHGGHSPAWGADGELVYVDSGGELMTVARADTASPGAARPLFRISSAGLPAYEYRFGGYCVDPTGERFLIVLSARPSLPIRN